MELMQCPSCYHYIHSEEFVAMRFDLPCPTCNQVKVSDFILVIKESNDE